MSAFLKLLFFSLIHFQPHTVHIFSSYILEGACAGEEITGALGSPGLILCPRSVFKREYRHIIWPRWPCFCTLYLMTIGNNIFNVPSLSQRPDKWKLSLPTLSPDDPPSPLTAALWVTLRAAVYCIPSTHNESSLWGVKEHKNIVSNRHKAQSTKQGMEVL